MKNNKGKWLNLLRVCVSVGALGFLFWEIGLGETLAVLRRADARYLLAAWLLYLASLVIRAYRWLTLLRGLGSEMPFGRLVYLYFVGQFYSSFLPTQFGGDVARAFESAQESHAGAAAVGAVVLDRMTGLMTLAAMGLVVLPFQAARMERWLAWTMVAVSGGILGGGLLLLEGRALRALTARLPGGLSLAGEGFLARLYAGVTGCGWRAVWRACGVSMLFNLVNIVINWLCGMTVGAGVGLGYFFAVTPLLAVSGLLPSVGGWGVREATSAALFTPAGVSVNVAAALGMALNGVSLATGLIGGVWYGIEGLRGLRGCKYRRDI